MAREAPKLAKSSYMFFVKKNDFYISRAIKVVLAQIQIHLQLYSTEVLLYCTVSRPRQQILSATTATCLHYDGTPFVIYQMLFYNYNFSDRSATKKKKYSILLFKLKYNYFCIAGI